MIKVNSEHHRLLSLLYTLKNNTFLVGSDGLRQSSNWITLIEKRLVEHRTVNDKTSVLSLTRLGKAIIKRYGTYEAI